MNCPKCGSQDVTNVAGTMRCNQCQEYFVPPAVPEAMKDVTVQPVIIYELPEVRASREKLRKKAESHVRSSITCYVIGVLLIFLGILASAFWALSAAGFFITCGFVSYIVGQLLHIRANTEE